MKTVRKILIAMVYTIVLFLAISDGHFRIQKADTIILNANVYTQDNRNSRTKAIALKNGRILDTGSEYKILRYATENTEFKDLDGRAVIPQKENAKIKRGKVADFLILETNYIKTSENQSLKLKVHNTIIGGKII